jgi:eukaryotic-like serine/threonine-protein kinase
MSERTLGGYRLLSQLAVGGMAEIYVAKAAGVGGWEKLVALKVIHPNFSEDPEFVQMLVDEAKLAVQLQHANIVQTFDLGRVDEQYYIAMELIDGVDLYKLLRQASEREIDFPYEIAAFIAQEACNGLDYAHRKRDSKGRPLQIVHRDVSPQNILCSFDGEVKIVDFGIAKAARRGRQTAAGVIKGKYYYMSPEQAWGDPIDGRTDVFSTGILLYEMLVGQMLYLEEDLDTLLDKVRKANIPPPSTKRAGLPTDLEGVVMRALRKRADDRFPTAGEMGVALGKFLRDYAPDFNRARLSNFIQDVLGDDPTSKTRDPRAATAMTREHLPRDENSLIFKLAELKPEPRASRKPDQATSPVSLPELKKSLEAPGLYDSEPRATGFEESEADATIVDGGAMMMGDAGGDSTRPMGAPLLRDLAPMPLADDPARDPDEEETISGLPPARLAAAEDAEQRLPGVRARAGASPTPAAGAGARPIARPVAARAPSADRPPASASPSAAPPSPSLPSGDRSPAPSRAAPSSDRSPAPSRAAPSSDRSPAPSRDAPASDRSPPSRDAPARDRSPPPSRAAAPAPLPPLPPGERPGPARSSPANDRPPPPRSAPPSLSDDDEPETGQRPMPTVEMRKPARPGRADPPSPTGSRPPSPSPEFSPEAKAAATINLGPRHNPVAGFSDGDDPTIVPPPRPPPSDPWSAPQPAGKVWPPPSQPRAADAWPIGPPTSPSAPISVGGAGLLAGRRGRILLIAAAVSLLLVAALALALAGSSGPDRATIQVVSLPPGAEVLLDEKKLEKLTPLDIPDVDAQLPHHVRVSMRGYDVWESDVKFETGARQIRLQAVLVPTVGSVEVTTTPPGAEVLINGVFRGNTPITVDDLPPNIPIDLQLTRSGYKRVSRSVPWQGKRKLTIDIPLEKNR